MSSYLFTYGTLLSGICHPMHEILLRHASLQETGFINGKLYELGSYPGLVLSNSVKKIVWGEIYRIHEEVELFKYLDDYEGCADHSSQPHEYRRDLVSIQGLDQGSLLAWTYLYKLPVNQLQFIPDGDYLFYRNKGRLRFVND